MYRMNMSFLKFVVMKLSTIYLGAQRILPLLSTFNISFCQIRSKRPAHNKPFSASMYYIKISALRAVFLLWA